MSCDYSAGITVHLRNGAAVTHDDEMKVRAAVEAIRQGEAGFGPRYGEFLFRYGDCMADVTFGDGIYISLAEYFIDDKANEAPARVLVLRDIPATEELAAELQEKLGVEFEVGTCTMD